MLKILFEPKISAVTLLRAQSSIFELKLLGIWPIFLQKLREEGWEQRLLETEARLQSEIDALQDKTEANAGDNVEALKVRQEYALNFLSMLRDSRQTLLYT